MTDKYSFTGKHARQNVVLVCSVLCWLVIASSALHSNMNLKSRILELALLRFRITNMEKELSAIVVEEKNRGDYGGKAALLGKKIKASRKRYTILDSRLPYPPPAENECLYIRYLIGFGSRRFLIDHGKVPLSAYELSDFYLDEYFLSCPMERDYTISHSTSECRINVVCPNHGTVSVKTVRDIL